MWENSSGDETGSDSVKYWEIIANRLSAAGWTWGYYSTVTCHAGTLRGIFGWGVNIIRANGCNWAGEPDDGLSK